MPKNENLSPIELAKFAGYFDGEGCVTYSSNTRTLFARINSADLENLRAFYNAFGGYFAPVKNSGRRQIYAWVLTGKKAQGFLLQVLPYLEAKREVALLGLTIEFGPSGVKISPEQKLVREKVQAKLHTINQRVDVWLT